MTAPAAPRPTCACGHDRYHHAIRPAFKHGPFAWTLLFTGVSAEPKGITFRCAVCGEAFETTTDPRVRKEFRRYPYVDRRPGT